MAEVHTQLLAAGQILFEQLPRRDIERLGEFFDDRHSRVTPPALDVADIGPMDAGPVGIVFLTPSFGFTEPANILTKACAYFHAGLQARPSPIDLQTISDI